MTTNISLGALLHSRSPEARTDLNPEINTFLSEWRRLNKHQTEKIITDLDKDFKVLENNETRCIPEFNFYHVFLPFFANISNHYNVDIASWIGISGSVFNPVNLLDKNNKIVYQVPPLLARKAYQGFRNQKFDFLSEITETEKRMTITPQHGQNYFSQKLAEANFDISPNQEVLDLKKAWDDLFAHYNTVPVRVTKEGEKVEMASGIAVPEETIKETLNDLDEDGWE